MNETVLDLEWFENDLCQRGPGSFDQFCIRNEPIDAVAACSTWLCFQDWDYGPREDEDQEPAIEVAAALPPVEPWDLAPPRPYVAPPKIGRNEPCPCGSGKKYKKCCGK